MNSQDEAVKTAQHDEPWWLIVIKGIFMGAVELVPGVSAGTLALITGILPRLLAALRNINITALNLLWKKEVKAAWLHIDGNFLLLLALGIFSGFALLIQGISYALANHPVLIWSFFFGLILASAVWLAFQIHQWKRLDVVLFFVLGMAFAYYITVTSPLYFPLTNWNIFFAGMIAISAMMLPGLSGSFILMLAGMYVPILSALKALQFEVIAVFMAGASIGILGFSHILSFLFAKFPLQVYALLTGIMLGSLNRIWPWQEVLQYRTNSHGEQTPMLTQSVSPAYFENILNQDAQLIWACVFMLLGVVVVWIMSHMEGLLSTSEDLQEKRSIQQANKHTGV